MPSTWDVYKTAEQINAAPVLRHSKHNNFCCLSPRLQVALSTKDVYKTAEQIRAAGGAISREPGPVPGIGTKIMATIDPDGYKWVFVDEEDFNKELEEAAKQQ